MTLKNRDGFDYSGTCPCSACQEIKRELTSFQSRTIYVDRAGTASSKHPFIDYARQNDTTDALVYALDAAASVDKALDHSIVDELCGAMGRMITTSDILPQTASPADEGAKRKATPIWSGVMRYFPDALAAVARLSKAGNDKHNPGQPLHWAREKSTDHGDCIARHQMEPEEIDWETGELHAAAVAWRALAQLQLLEEKRLGKGVIDATAKDATNHSYRPGGIIWRKR